MGRRAACSIPAASTNVFGISCACAWPMIQPSATAPNPRVKAIFIAFLPWLRDFNLPRLVLIMRPRHEQLGNQRGPPRLMRCPDAAAGVAVKILVERNAVLVIRICLQ